MTILVESKRKKPATLAERYPGAQVLDVTSQGQQPWVKFSPFYPHGSIPVPLSPGHVAASVEGIWQGLKVFANADIDLATFTNTSMRGIKRTVRSNGQVHGHRAGVHGTTLLAYREARYQIYLPAYRWVLDHCLQANLQQLRDLSASSTVVLLDYETNTDLENLSKPLSHAGLIVKYLNDQWPC
ncbi:MAG: hypothetical protein MUD01_27430 [Chloroflexaceae bacterium]|nr:hypothetical protein [Chloroflexaceae bacterium]